MEDHDAEVDIVRYFLLNWPLNVGGESHESDDGIRVRRSETMARCTLLFCVSFRLLQLSFFLSFLFFFFFFKNSYSTLFL